MALLDTLKTIAMAIILIVVAVSWLAKYFPSVAWMQRFRLPEVPRTDAQKVRRRRAANRFAAFEMMIFSLAFPGIYLLSRIMMFEEPKLGPLLLWSSGTVICWIIAIIILVRNSRNADDERLADFVNRR